ncbi:MULTISPECIES: zinc ribbon domain-containing protein [Paenibacillus]|jgi:hypothetical protein|uniref:Zinc-ribbon domain-containing protein n=2 Tax=Paenibacillus lactis TaxID=228574 RepID=G4HGZ7_9BACL|nr:MULTISPECIES: zinc ribbon domain-containing protein [Paenibacillus]EHB63373.1 hypothetical protein PaelaDRAFT_3258 [Paenibacillus lactis 154]MBP1891652.1 RNA polymerase subunit RPABC4/transcription elongation factor Spt4 [Paenibacillus lactis]MCM3494115.1 zinc ribbon domain-containing protein [Paenibacillus lactis]GIO88896.1 hypothetical protein J31TS3_01230 [Paenibacillus lactis]HAG00345.1 zinc ribbon domain-containing protein [Paenibacillus lactis]
MNILQRLKDGANRATEKAQHVVEVNKLNSQIAEIEQQKNSYYLQMGKVFYEGYRMQDMSVAEQEMVELAKTCDGLQEKIEEIRNRIAVLKNERVCQCGRVVALDANFCPNCGRKLASIAPKEEEPIEKAVKEPELNKVRFDFEDEDEADAYAAAADERDHEPFTYRQGPEPFSPVDEELLEPEVDPEQLRLEQEEQEKERRHWEELERERERQLELDRRIRFWQENNQNQDYVSGEETVRDTVKCQICSVDLPKGSKWCPRCGAEQI